MSLRVWVLVLLAIAAIGWWFSPISPRFRPPAPTAVGSAPGCRPPVRGVTGAAPLQSAVPEDLRPFRLRTATLQPLAGLSLDARVLAREDYSFGREAEYSPTDLALGWQRMSEDAVLARLDITQSARWYRYRWQHAPPLPLAEIVRSSANMHMIPSDSATAAALARVRAGQRVRIEGWLVEVQANDGWHWRSSLTREDSGSGACEVVYVCDLRVQ